MAAIAVTTLAALVFPVILPAQEPAPANEEIWSNVLEEVVVTARRIQESLQDVPVSVTAVSGETLKHYELFKVQELAVRIPTMQIVVGGNGSGGALTLRGIGQPLSSGGFDSAVLLNIDDVPLSSMRLVQNVFMDIDRVEVLRGPQALYYGKSASAGVMSFKTADPGVVFEATGSVAYEFEEQGRIVEGVLSGPLGETFGARLAVRYMDSDEMMVNVAPGVANPDRGEESFNGRLTLAWDPLEKLRLNLKYTYSDYENDGAAQFPQSLCGGPRPALVAYPFFAFQALGVPTVPPGYDCDMWRSEDFYIPDQLPLEAAQFPGNNGGVPYQQIETSLARLRIDWDINDSLTFTSITSHLSMESLGMDNYAFSQPGGGISLEDIDLTDLTQEIRLASEFDGRVNFQLGAFYQDRDQRFSASQTAFGATASADFLFTATGGMLGWPGGADLITGNTFDWLYNNNQETTSKSIYGALHIDLNDRWVLAGGLRYTDEGRDGVIDVPYTHLLLQASGATVPSGFVSPPIRFSDTNTSGELTLSYFASDRVMVYGAYKTGFKAGGIDTSALPTAGFLDPLDNVVFDSETSKGFELGVKSELAGRTLRLNGVVYRYVFDDLQTQQFSGETIAFKTFNAGEITTQGIELDLDWATEVEGLDVLGAIGYLDAEFTDTFVSEKGVDLEGRAPRQAPEWSGNIGARYSVPVGSAYQLSLGANMAFSSSYFVSDETFDDYRQGSYTRFDLRAAFGSDRGRWDVSLVANNVTDELYSQFGNDRPFSIPEAFTGQPVDTSHRMNRGRQVFLRLTIRN